MGGIHGCILLLNELLHSSHHYATLTLNNQPLDLVDTFKYLGVTLSRDMSWSHHINSVCAKARQILGLIYRRFYHHSDSATILTLYVSLVRPYLEYASPVWSPYTIGDIAQLERVQKFALRMAAHDWSANYQDLLDKFEIPSLERRRLDLSVSHLYKIVNNLCYFPSGLIQFRPHHVYNTCSSHSPILLQPFAHTTYYLKSFIPNTISL